MNFDNTTSRLQIIQGSKVAIDVWQNLSVLKL